ncbi:hypothetical protein NP284_17675 [Rhodopseudomonas pseudopalustris]
MAKTSAGLLASPVFFRHIAKADALVAKADAAGINDVMPRRSAATATKRAEFRAHVL